LTDNNWKVVTPVYVRDAGLLYLLSLQTTQYDQNISYVTENSTAS